MSSPIGVEFSLTRFHNHLLIDQSIIKISVIGEILFIPDLIFSSKSVQDYRSQDPSFQKLCVLEKDRRIKGLEKDILGKDGKVKQLEIDALGKNGKIKELEKDTIGKDRKIKELEQGSHQLRKSDFCSEFGLFREKAPKMLRISDTLEHWIGN